MSRPDDSFLNPQQLAAVRRHADRLLLDASALRRFPTPIDDLMSAAKLTVVPDEVLNASFLQQFMKRAKAGVSSIKSALSKVFGLFDAEDRLVIIGTETPRPKVPFLKLHEAGHGSIPHQSKMFRFIHDCEKTLDADITDLFEREANVFASEVLFQGDVFAEEAHDQTFGINVPMSLASKFGASQYATIRRYATTSPHACCLVVLEPTQGKAGGFSAEVRRVVMNESCSVLVWGKELHLTVDRSHLLAPLVPRFGKQKMVKETEIVLSGRNGEERVCVAESFNTGRNTLILIRDGKKQPKRGIVVPASVGVIHRL